MKGNMRDIMFTEYIFMGLAWVFAYFYPVYPMMLTIGFFIIGDTILGVLAANKLGTLGHKASKKYRPAISKFIGYGIAILVAQVIEKQFLQDFPAMKLVSGYLAFIELKSIDENFKTISGVSVFGVVLDRMKPKKEDA
jgi:hypothetical protein